jgi:HNH endonuclease/NUMOD3 motif
MQGTRDAKGHFVKGYWNVEEKMSKDVRNKISKAHKGKIITPEQRRKIGESLKGNRCHWQGGTTITDGGYRMIRATDHPENSGGYVREHRLIVEKIIGRYLEKEEVLHHINKRRTDNRPENLMAFSSHSAHRRFHLNPDSVKANEIIFDGRNIHQ